MMLLYARGDRYIWNDLFSPLPASTVDKWYRHVEAETGRRYNKADITGPGGAVKGNPVYEWRGITKAWRFSKESMERLEAEGRIVYTESGMPYLKRYLDESKGVPLQDVWDEISMIRGIQRRDAAAYPTEKPVRLIERVLAINSNPNDLVLDCFVGSGTTAAVAQKFGRRWIACDINRGAIQTTAKRLQTIIESQTHDCAQRAPSLQLDEEDVEADAPPAQLGFTVWRVNDYDLAIQHNEAVNLACEHIGVERTRTDSYFDGVRGKKLVKIIPFGHALSLLDLEELKRELEARPDEDREITVVCLGKELAADTWLEEWNRHRTGKEAVNRIEVIELRTDPRYGRFMEHRLAVAKVSIKREGEQIVVDVEDFISPTILERLSTQSGLAQPKIDDWRPMVDCVMIDPAHDGEVFNVALADVPERKTDYVTGHYELPAPPGETTVAVKVVDMVGEEVVVVQRV